MLKKKYDINQKDLKTVDLHFAKTELVSLTWSCGSRQRNTASSGWKFRLNNLAVKGLTCCLHVYDDLTPTTQKYFCINHGDQRFFQFEIIINVLAPSASYIYLCYASTTITTLINCKLKKKMLILSVRGSCLYVKIGSLQTSDYKIYFSKDCPSLKGLKGEEDA